MMPVAVMALSQECSGSGPRSRTTYNCVWLDCGRWTGGCQDPTKTGNGFMLFIYVDSALFSVLS